MKYLYIIFILLIGLIFQVSADSIILDIAHDGYPVDWTTPTTNPTTTYFPGYYPSLELGTSLFFQCITMIFIFFSSDPGIWFIALAIALIFLALFKRILYMQTRRK